MQKVLRLKFWGNHTPEKSHKPKPGGGQHSPPIKNKTMQHTFAHHIETPTGETALTITYEYSPPSAGQRGPHGESLEPDAESEIEILSVTDEGGNDYQPETIENINSHCWDDLLEYFGI